MSAAESAESIALELFETREGRTDPYPRYHQLRRLEPVHHNRTLGVWLLSRYRDVAAMLRDPRFGKNYSGQMENRFGSSWREHPSLLAGEDSILNMEGAEHTRLRRLVVKAFNRRIVDGLRPMIEDAVNEYLEPYAEQGGGDLLAALAFPMPVTVIGELLGVPPEDRAPFRKWVVDLTAIFEMSPTEEQLRAADTAQLEIRRYFDGLIEQKRRDPDGKLLSRLVHLDSDGDRLNQDELASMGSLVFLAGFETTTNLIGNGLLGLLQHPDQMELLRAQPDLFSTLPDEILRYDGTAQMVVRYTHDDVEIGGVKIPAGELVFGLLGAANHDPDEFDEPDAINLKRGRFRPMSFGGGAHFCLGANLAKAEIEIVLRRIFERFESIELVGEAPRFRDRLTLRGLESLELRVRSGATRDLRRPASEIAIDTTSASASESRETEVPQASQVRPVPGSAADRRWRNALRTKVESDAATSNVSWERTGEDLAGTIVLLARTELFRSCRASEIADLAATAYPMSFEPGDHLCVEGAESLECYVIEEGDAVVTIGGEQVRTVGENDVIGERGLLEDNPRSATVTATSHMLTYAISRERLLSLVNGNPDARKAMFDHMRQRYR